MNIVRQLGQSMTEYMVVLGVTGISLLAATTDVSELFDNVHKSYSTQSNEMSKVQLYNNQKVRFNENPPGGGEFDDGDTPPPHEGDPPADQLPSIEWVYDSDGSLLGQMSSNTLKDDDGNIIAWCERTVTGDCVFTDSEGKPIFIGATNDRQWVDEHGNELPIIALTSGGEVYGFAYQYKDKLYSAYDRKQLNPQPTGFDIEPLRRVQSYDAQGVPHTEGYELGGAFYSHKATLNPDPPDSSTPVATENKELVEVVFTHPPTAMWEGYTRCLVMPGGWTSSNIINTPLEGAWEAKFNDPSLRMGSESVGGFIDTSECRGASTVTHDPATGSWTQTR